MEEQNFFLKQTKTEATDHFVEAAQVVGDDLGLRSELHQRRQFLVAVVLVVVVVVVVVVFVVVVSVADALAVPSLLPPPERANKTNHRPT